MRSNSGLEDASCLPQPPCFSSLGSQGPAISHFDWVYYHPFTFTCMSLKVRKCINPWELKCVLSSDGSKFLRTMFSTWVHLHIENVLDYLLALLNNCCPVLLLILEELKQGIGGHLARRLLGVGRKELVNLRPLQKVVIEGNKLVFIQGLKRMELP